jgi:hypothetical protein
MSSLGSESRPVSSFSTSRANSSRGIDRTLCRLRRLQQVQRWEHFSIKSAVAGEQTRCLDLRVRADQEVGKDALSLASLLAVSSPDPTRKKTGRPIQRVSANADVDEKFVSLLLRIEAHTQLGIHKLTYNQRPPSCRSLQRLAGSLHKVLVRQQDVQQDICVHSGNHLPRTLST